VVALGRAALVVVDVGLGWRAIYARGIVVGIAHPGPGPFGEYRFERRTCLGVEQAADLAHAVGLLFTHRHVPAPGAVDIGEVAVGVYQRHQPVGGFA
jgi:hypothetical protein